MTLDGEGTITEDEAKERAQNVKGKNRDDREDQAKSADLDDPSKQKGEPE